MQEEKSKPPSSKYKMLVVTLALAIVAIGLSRWYFSTEKGATVLRDFGTVQRSDSPKAQVDTESASHPGYNPQFDDSALVQTRWIGRAADIIDLNLPDYATSAVVKEPFFHRGFKNKATICGEVQFYRDEELVMDFQRFVFPGGYVVHYENDVKNFQIYWDKVCKELDPAN